MSTRMKHMVRAQHSCHQSDSQLCGGPVSSLFSCIRQSSVAPLSLVLVNSSVALCCGSRRPRKKPSAIRMELQAALLDHSSSTQQSSSSATVVTEPFSGQQHVCVCYIICSVWNCNVSCLNIAAPCHSQWLPQVSGRCHSNY